MSYLSKIDKGIKAVPQMYVFHSAPGVGKTTFASKFPSPIFADLEDGSKHLDVPRLTSQDLPDYKALLAFIDELTTSNSTYKTLVIDSATVLESYIHRHVCAGKYDSIEELGFGKGYQMAREELQKLMQKLRRLAAKMDVIITAHSQVKGFTDPINNSSYDRYIIQTHAKFAEILTSTADNVFFFKHNVATVTDKNTKKTQAFSSGERLIMTEWRAAFEAKNRLNIPAELPLDYTAFQAAIENAKPKTAEELVADIKALCLKADAELAETAKEKVQQAKGDVQALIRIKAKVASQVVVA
jgi:hypothetical protein